jgi:hypothetical protein
MTPPFVEHRNRYRGLTPRPWLRIRVLDPGDQPLELTLVADTGCPHAMIVDTGMLTALARISGLTTVSNFGPMIGGWIRLAMPDFGIDQDMLCYGSPVIKVAVEADDPSFQGLLGLPILQLAEYGGNATDFWFRYPPSTTTSLP